eukprot:58852_1
MNGLCHIYVTVSKLFTTKMSTHFKTSHAQNSYKIQFPIDPRLNINRYNSPNVNSKLPLRQIQLNKPNTKPQIRLPENIKPLKYLSTHNTIESSIMMHLIQMTEGRIRDVSVKIKGIHKISNYLWKKVRICSDICGKETYSAIYIKIKAHKVKEFMEWIPKQEKEFTDSWQRLRHQYSAESVLNDLITRNSNNSELQKCINQFRGTLRNFINAIRKIYKGTKCAPPVKKFSRTKSANSICWRCGKMNHSSYECLSERDINGKILNKSDPCRFKPKTANSEKGNCYRCGRDTHVINHCTEQFHHNGEKLQPYITCAKCGYFNHKSIDCFFRLKKVKKQLKKCFKCGEYGHKQYKCTAAQVATKKTIGVKRKKLERMVKEINIQPAFKRRKIVDKVQIKVENVHSQDIIIVKTEPIDMDIEQDIDMDKDESEAERVMLNCSNCCVDLRNKDVWRCSKCKLSFYCNKKCQLDNWKIHKMRCGKSIVDVKIERVSVNDWNCYAIIYWFNRVNNGMFNDIKYKELRKHIVVGKIKGCDLMSINNITLRMMRIYDMIEQQSILNAIKDVIMNDNFNNIIANIMKIDDIPMKYVDVTTYEIMNEPVKIMQSG